MLRFPPLLLSSWVPYPKWSLTAAPRDSQTQDSAYF